MARCSADHAYPPSDRGGRRLFYLTIITLLPNSVRIEPDAPLGDHPLHRGYRLDSVTLGDEIGERRDPTRRALGNSLASGAPVDFLGHRATGPEPDGRRPGLEVTGEWGGDPSKISWRATSLLKAIVHVDLLDPRLQAYRRLGLRQR